MVHLALGYECRVYDFGSRQARWATEDGKFQATYVPRALWWGLEWCRFALNNIWKLPDANQTPLFRGHNVEGMFRQELQKLSKPQKRRLKYYRSLAIDDLEGVRLAGYYAKAQTDGDKDAHRKLLHDFGREETARLELARGDANPTLFGMKRYDTAEARDLRNEYFKTRSERIQLVKGKVPTP